MDGKVKNGSVALTEAERQNLRWCFFKQPEDKTVLPPTTLSPPDAEAALYGV